MSTCAESLPQPHSAQWAGRKQTTVVQAIAHWLSACSELCVGGESDLTKVYTHSAVARTFSLRGVQISRTRMAQVQGLSVMKKKVCCTVHVVSLRLALSILMFQPPSLLFPDGQFSCSTSLLELFLPPNRGACALPHERRGVCLYGRFSALHRL